MDVINFREKILENGVWLKNCSVGYAVYLVKNVVRQPVDWCYIKD